jgi:hypothetical protein
LFSSSPDNKYFAFRSRVVSGCASACHNFYMYIADLVGKRLTHVSPPRREQEYSGQKESPTEIVMPFIESYTWNTDDSLNVTVALVTTEDGSSYFRISPKEIWRYDLATKQYALVETLPE